MPEELMFPQNPNRWDPYRTFKFKVVMYGGRVVAGLRKMTALKRTTEVISWRLAGDPSHDRKLPGGTKYEPITLEQGLSHDPEFEAWANRVNSLQGDKQMSLISFRQNLTIKVLDLQGNEVLEYQVRDAWVSEFQALPDLDAGTTNTVGIQSIKVEHEGWARVDLGLPTRT
jgi:phage tail-like protein